MGLLRWGVVATCALHLCWTGLGPVEYGWGAGTVHFVHLNVSVLLLALLVARRLSDREAGLHMLSRALLIAFGIPILICTVLGGVGLLNLFCVSVVMDVSLGAWAVAMGRGGLVGLVDSVKPHRDRRAAAGWMLLAVIGMGALFAWRAWGSRYWMLPPTHWDDHLYHLTYPAQSS